MIGSRIGWVGSSAPNARAGMGASATDSSRTTDSQPAKKNSLGAPKGSNSAAVNPSPDSNGLVVYDQGKVVFRMKPAPHAAQNKTTSESESSVSPQPAVVWLAPDIAEQRLKQRVEPLYPAEARAAHRSGDVMLEVMVSTDGSITSVRALTGDPLLAEAAATAVREWHYEPYRLQGRAAEFQTNVTLKFALPE